MTYTRHYNPISIKVDNSQLIYHLENGHGASVIQNSMSYGHEHDQWELAVIRWTDNDWSLCYDTPITSDVIGYCTQQDLDILLDRIASL